MQTIDGRSLVDLSGKGDLMRAALPAPGPAQMLITIPPMPDRLPVVTTVRRGATTLGYVVTPFGAPVPSAASITLGSGTLWIAAPLLGAAFASTAGFAGIPFASAKMTVTGAVTFGGGNIVLDAAATLSFAVSSATSPATGPAGDPIGPDFLAARLTPFPTGTGTLAPAGATIAPVRDTSALVYEQSLTLTPAASPTPALLDFTTPHIAIPCNIARRRSRSRCRHRRKS